MQITVRDLKQLGNAVRRIRKAKNMTQAELAKRSGVIPYRISDIENGKRGTIEKIFKLIAALEMEIVLRPIETRGKVFNPEEFYRG